MTKVQQDRHVLDGVDRLRRILDEIEVSVVEDSPLRTLEIAEGIGDVADSILWSATASARTVPGTTWAVIGGRLGITRQAAHQRLSTPPRLDGPSGS
jgi:hypothetical protein